VVGGPLTIVSYLGNGVNVVNQSVSGAVNNDVQYSNAGDYDAYSVRSPTPGCCRFEKCVTDLARQLQTENFRISNYSVLGPNCNSFAHRLVLQCGGRVKGNPGQDLAYGWEAPWNITF